MFLFATNTVGEKEEAALVAEEILIRIDAVIEIREEIRGFSRGRNRGSKNDNMCPCWN